MLTRLANYHHYRRSGLCRSCAWGLSRLDAPPLVQVDRIERITFDALVFTGAAALIWLAIYCSARIIMAFLGRGDA
jgi:hypothetical protein